MVISVTPIAADQHTSIQNTTNKKNKPLHLLKGNFTWEEISVYINITRYYSRSFHHDILTQYDEQLVFSNYVKKEKNTKNPHKNGE